MCEIAVSIICLTYNQKNYIKDALEGFLMQKTNFVYEILIHDDASTDGTIEILNAYKQQYPEKIRLILEKENQYSRGVNITREIVLPQVKGKYVAYCEGDDFWIYSGKLQMQYELMESDSEISLCYHNALVYEEQGDILKLNVNNHPSGYIEDRDIIYASKGWYPTASILVRTDFFKELPDLKGATGDVVWRTCMACRGKLYFFNRAWSVYRSFARGSWNEKYCRDRRIAAQYIVDTVDYFRKFDSYSEGRFSGYLHRVYMGSVGRFFTMYYSDGYTVKQFEKGLSELKQLSEHKVDDIIDKFHDEYIIRSINYYDDAVSNKIKRILCEENDIYIYGAGGEAIKAIIALTNNNIDIAGLIVSKKEEKRDMLLGYHIYSLEDIKLSESIYIWPCLIDGREDVLKVLNMMSLSQIII